MSKHHRTPLISLLIPFRSDNKSRREVFNWILQYWECELPDAEIVIGRDWGIPFSKSGAVNDAARRASGKYFVIIDADAYLPGDVIRTAVARIERAARKGHRLWYIPYRRVFRLTPEASRRVLDSDPCDPERFPSPPDDLDVESMEGSAFGHHFGALIQIMPREAFFAVGGMDPRFRGWGGEDVSFVRAVDTLWGKHKTTRNDVLHLYHTRIGHGGWRTREWEGQKKPRANDWLSIKYNVATGDLDKMRTLVALGHQVGSRDTWLHKAWYLLFNFIRTVARNGGDPSGSPRRDAHEDTEGGD